MTDRSRHDDSFFLANLLEGSGIVAIHSVSEFGRSTQVVVARRDVPLALPLVNDFKEPQQWGAVIGSGSILLAALLGFVSGLVWMLWTGRLS